MLAMTSEASATRLLEAIDDLIRAEPKSLRSDNSKIDFDDYASVIESIKLQDRINPAPDSRRFSEAHSVLPAFSARQSW